MLISGLAGFAIYLVRSSAQNLIVACVFSLAISTANFVIGAVVVDIFPTNIGAMAICMMTFFGRVGAIASNLAFGMLLDISCEVPIFLVGGIVVCECFHVFIISLWKIAFPYGKSVQMMVIFRAKFILNLPRF